MIPKVTVIIPVYKAAKDIERCCKSLFGQTLESIEYIFVDDCTPDNSVEIIMHTLVDYPERKPFVKVLHQEKNSGVSSCRQLGLHNATGEFIIHCDSDDWPETNMYEMLYNVAIIEKAELVSCDYFVEYVSHTSLVVFPDQYVSRPSFCIYPVEGAVWNKLISRKLINRCGAEFFQGINLGEDYGFVTPCRVMSKKNAVVHQPLYHYNQLNQNSITHNYSKEHFMQTVELAQRLDVYFKNNNLEMDYYRELCKMKYMCKMFFLIYSETRDIKLWIKLFPECHKYIWSYEVPLYLKVSSWLIANGLSSLGGGILSLKSKIKHN